MLNDITESSPRSLYFNRSFYSEKEKKNFFYKLRKSNNSKNLKINVKSKLRWAKVPSPIQTKKLGLLLNRIKTSREKRTHDKRIRDNICQTIVWSRRHSPHSRQLTNVMLVLQSRDYFKHGKTYLNRLTFPDEIRKLKFMSIYINKFIIYYLKQDSGLNMYWINRCKNKGYLNKRTLQYLKNWNYTILQKLNMFH